MCSFASINYNVYRLIQCDFDFFQKALRATSVEVICDYFKYLELWKETVGDQSQFGVKK